ncbi:multicopper oxidase [Auriscalpium vulgare]|uniref:Multicopper oxidase n=1 Tax=Auriscalpium vulgare TaxID=40419 RepID=A0ACB8R629_9AGAM|nr:multicopper oxidase [Auriscalpium vulgare]
MASRKSSRRRGRPLLLILAVVVVLALALGLGLGLGLQHHHHHDSASASGSSANLPALQAPAEGNFVVGSILGQPPQTREYNFTVEMVQGAPDGVSRTMLVVNGMYPGPTIEVNQADRLVVNVQNNLPNTTSIHWHGLFQNGTNWYDGTSGITECGIPPGQSLTYNFTLGEFSGTTWWHAHFSTQYTDGITGPLIVHPTAPSPPGLPQWDEELVVHMADWYHDLSADLLDAYLSPFGIDGTQGDEPVPDGGMLNGLGQYFAAGTGGSYFNFTLQRNKTYRLRLINSGSFASVRFSVDGHPLTLIEADGTLISPTPLAGITLAVAQRYSVLLHANATGSPNSTYWMRAAVQSDMFTYDQPGQNLDIRGIIRYDDASPSGLPGDPASADPGSGAQGLQDVDGTTALVPLVADPAPNFTVAFPIVFDFQNTDDGRFLGFINSSSWEPLKGQSTLLAVLGSPSGYAPVGSSVATGDQLIATVDSIQVVDIRVDNLDDGDHPFHLHGHRPWIMGAGAGRYIGQSLNVTNPLRRDTILIPAYSWMVLRFVTDNPGLWAFHCHLAWHMAAGLLMQFNSLPSTLAGMDVPADIVAQCKAAK